MIYLLQHLLEQTAAASPQNIAVRMDTQSITYKELCEKSSRLANQMIALGFVPGFPAGIYLSKSIEAVITMFAVLKAGGAYIPLDASHSPIFRIKGIIELSEMDFIVTHSSLWTGFLSELTEADMGLVKDMKVILVDHMLAAGESTKTPGNRLACTQNGHVNLCEYDHSFPEELSGEPDITDDDLAYILYTSGSTGVPKGVMLTHRNALTFISWALSYFKPTEKDVFSNVAPLHFDLSVFDVYVSIACGACLHLLPPLLGSNPRAILSWIRENRITYFYSVPSLWMTLLQYTDIHEDDLPGLTHILFAGEIFPPARLKALMTLLPHAAYYNLYGPTETNVCTCYQVKHKDDVTDRPVPIGSGCANTEVIVLKDDNTLALLHEQGELLVKGSIVTKGYYKNPERTKAAFKKSPLPHHHGALFYKTGDIVRVIAPNTYQFVCRKDLMVKCCGYRIELQEIEHALIKHPAIRDAIVVPVYDDEQVHVVSLSAFITAVPGTGINVIEIKRFLTELLPRYMIPGAITVCKELPRNANGKADRQQLKDLAQKQVRVPVGHGSA